MSSVVISGDTSGSVTLSAPATAGSNTIVLPSGSGTLTLPSGTGTVSVNGVNSNIVAGTAVASTSGTTIPFTSIPSWAKRITVMLVGVSTNGTSNIQIQLGSGSTTTTGYLSGASYNAVSSLGTANSTTGLVIEGTTQSATNVRHGQVIISNVTGNTWVSSAIIGQSQTTAASFAGGSITLSGVLDRVVVTTVNGTDTFDAGSINILYE
jgi:hypothetical protein